tara:strand:- start:1998 stop:3623 length:1626 start_codon:yes stop_codon:yes gene_type:complete
VKQKTKGYLAFAFLGGILLTSTVLFALPPPPATMTEEEAAMEMQSNEKPIITKTGTPMDNFPDDQRATFCGVGDAKSNFYVTEYMIPTVCTQPLAIKVAPDGNVWFIESNAGQIAKFDPISEKFTEFKNDVWPEGGTTMSWGMDYSPDGGIWYTDGQYDTLWRFDIFDEKYSAVSYPASERGSLPQKLSIHGSNIIVNDFAGSKLTFFDLATNTDEITYSSIVSPIPNSFTGDFAVDSQNNLWYTNWVPDSTGLLLKFNIEKYKQDSFLVTTGMDMPIENYFEVFDFPLHLNTPNGLSIDENDNVWIADTSSSFFFKFEPSTEQFTKFITSAPQKSTYGNATGVVKSPISRPYWSQTDMNGNLFLNAQTSNQLAVFDIQNERLIEYMVPSKNPNWADCENKSDSNCGVAQIFGFDVVDDKIWFTEWVENKIGVVDLSKPLPFTVNTDKDLITLKKGGTETITLTVDSVSDIGKFNFNSAHTASSVTSSSDIKISHTIKQPNEIIVNITANQIALLGDYKLLLGVYNSEVNVSKYIDVTIEP